MKVQNISRRVVSSFCRTAFVAVFFGIGAVTISVNTASAQSADDGFTIPDFPEMDQAISNVVLYLDDGMSNITKVRVEDFTLIWPTSTGPKSRT